MTKNDIVTVILFEPSIMTQYKWTGPSDTAKNSF